MTTGPTPRLLALGDSAWTLEFGHAIDPTIHARVMRLEERLHEVQGIDPLLAGVLDVVPTFRSLTVHYDPLVTDAHALGDCLLSWAQQTPHEQHDMHNGRLWHLPVCFDADCAPDLQRLSDAKGLHPDTVIQRLLNATFRVYMIGFQPGFPYMGGVPPELHMPRLAAPRQRVPAQSLAVAGDMCAVYPWESPGGWNLLGRTPVVLFDLCHTQQPALLRAGDKVRWHAVDHVTHDQLACDIAKGLPRDTFLQAPNT